MGKKKGEARPEIESLDIDELRSRLTAAEFALERLADVDGELDVSLKQMVDDAVDEVEAKLAEGRRKVTDLIADAEQLRTMAAHQIGLAQQQARTEVEAEAKGLLENARQLEAQAHKKAEIIEKDARAKVADSLKEADDRLAEAQEMYERVERHIASREAILDEVRNKADQIMRNAKTTAEGIREEAVAAAKKTTDAAKIEAEALVRAAKEEARNQLERVTVQERDAKERLERARSEMAK